MENKEKNFASAVVYVRNAENRLEKFLKTIISAMEDSFAHSEVICVNDASDDKSLEIIKKTSEMATSTSVSVINMSYFHGLELSMDAGIDMSIGDFVFEFDFCVHSNVFKFFSNVHLFFINLLSMVEYFLLLSVIMNCG